MQFSFRYFYELMTNTTEWKKTSCCGDPCVRQETVKEYEEKEIPDLNTYTSFN